MIPLAKEQIRTSVIKMTHRYPIRHNNSIYQFMSDRELSITDTRENIKTYMRVVYSVKPSEWFRRCEI